MATLEKNIEWILYISQQGLLAMPSWWTQLRINFYLHLTLSRFFWTALTLIANKKKLSSLHGVNKKTAEKRSLLEKQKGGHVKRFFWEMKLADMEHVFGKTKKMADL
jgi:hypothetical protein